MTVDAESEARKRLEWWQRLERFRASGRQLWLEFDPPSWVWPQFATHRHSPVDWETDPDFTTEITVIEEAKLQHVAVDDVGLRAHVEITRTSKQRVSVFDMVPAEGFGFIAPSGGVVAQ